MIFHETRKPERALSSIMEHQHHRQHQLSKRQKHQKNPEKPKKSTKRGYLTKLQIAGICFAAFVYRLISEYQSDWELAPSAYFDLDGGANADFLAGRLLLPTVPQFNMKSIKDEKLNTPSGDENVAWITHAGDGWLVGLSRKPVQTSLRTLAKWPHRVLGRMPADEAGLMPLAIEAATVDKKLFVACQSTFGRLHVFSSSENQNQLDHLYSVDPLASLSPIILSSYLTKPLTMTIIRAHCRQGYSVFACLLLVTAFRLNDKTGPVNVDLNQTVADLLPPVVLAFNLNNGSLVWQNSAQSSDMADHHDLAHDVNGISHHWKLEWARHLISRRLANARPFESVLPVYRGITPFSWRSDVDAALLSACLHCPSSGIGAARARQPDGNVLALRLGDSIDLFDPSSGIRLHRLRLDLDGRRGAYEVVDSRDGAIRVGVGLNCTGEAVSLDDSRIRRFDDLCDPASVDEADSSLSAAAAAPLLLPTPAGLQSGWRDFLGHFLGHPRSNRLALFLSSDGTLTAHSGIGGGFSFKSVGEQLRWRASTESSWNVGGSVGEQDAGPFLIGWQMPNLDLLAAVAIGNNRITIVDARNGRILASHSLPCQPAAPPAILEHYDDDEDSGEMAVACKRLLLRFRLRRLPPDWHWIGLVCAVAMATCLALAFLCC